MNRSGADSNFTTDRRVATAPGIGRAVLLLLALTGALIGATASSEPTPPPSGNPAPLADEPAAPALPPRDLVTHASSRRYWVSQVLPRTPGRGPSPTRSAVRVREAAGAANQGWQRVIVVQGRVIDLAHRADNAALLLEDGSWLLAWPGGSSTGPSLPAGSALRAIAADDASLWAVGAELARSPATTRAVESPDPTSTPPGRLQLYRFAPNEGAWSRRLPPLPDDIPLDAPVSIAVESDRPTVCLLIAPRRALVFRPAADGDSWDPPELIAPDFDVRAFELLSGTPSPTIWLAGPTGAGELRVRRAGGVWSAVSLATADADLGPAVARAAAWFAGYVRICWLAEPDTPRDRPTSPSTAPRIRERSFNLEGQPASDAVDLGRTPAPSAEPIGSGTLVLLGVLAALLAMNVLRADEDPPLSFDGRSVRLAPLPRRLVAGLIDLFPVFATAVWLIPLADASAAAETLQDPAFTGWMIAAVGVYLLHTTVSELATGRTLGKAAVGLRVVAVADGRRARPGAVLLRNVFRAVDVFPGLPLVVLILFSPLRQRLGDVVAGTVVITDAKPQDASPTPPDDA